VTGDSALRTGFSVARSVEHPPRSLPSRDSLNILAELERKSIGYPLPATYNGVAQRSILEPGRLRSGCVSDD